jgi:hAT family C-terminal dimerisation region
VAPFLRVYVEPCDDLSHPGKRVHVSPCVLAAALSPRTCRLDFLSPQERDAVWERLQFECLNFLSDTEKAVMGNDPDPVLICEVLQVTMLRRILEASAADDPIEFWRMQMRDSVLVQGCWSIMARMLLAIPASAAPCERLFSAMGTQDRRARGASLILPLLSFIRANVIHLGQSPDEQVDAILGLLDG